MGKKNFITIDGICFDSKEESEIYAWLRDGCLHSMTGIDEFKGAKLLDARPKSIELFKGFSAGPIKVRPRRYTADFLVKLNNGDEVVLEYKSKWSEAKADYRLRRSIFLFLYKDKLKFAELVKISKTTKKKKGVYLLHKYYN